MAYSISSCLNQFKPLPIISTTKPSPPQILGWERSWKTQGAIGIACTIIIGFQTANLAVSDQSIALVFESQHQQEHQREQEQEGEGEDVDVQVKLLNSKVERWSDKRSCIPWHINSLETIVPENLPRFSTPKKWRSIDSSQKYGHNHNHVFIKVLNQSKQCFSL